MGARKRQGKKHKAVAIDVRPVRPPASIPAALSIYAVPGEVPKSPAPRVASASTMSPCLSLSGCPRESTMPAAWETPTKVESESNKSVRKIETIAGISAGRSAPSRSSLNNTELKSGRLSGEEGKLTSPMIAAIAVTPKIAARNAKGLRLRRSHTLKRSPLRLSSGANPSVPALTKVTGSA